MHNITFTFNNKYQCSKFSGAHTVHYHLSNNIKGRNDADSLEQKKNMSIYCCIVATWKLVELAVSTLLGSL